MITSGKKSQETDAHRDGRYAKRGRRGPLISRKAMESMKSAATKPRGRRVVAASKNSALVINRRRQLVGAAIEVFSQKGFHATTVRDIGRASGLTQGTIYN